MTGMSARRARFESELVATFAPTLEAMRRVIGEFDAMAMRQRNTRDGRRGEAGECTTRDTLLCQIRVGERRGGPAGERMIPRVAFRTCSPHFCVHRGYGVDTGWTVTHRASGTAIVTDIPRTEDACKIAGALAGAPVEWASPRPGRPGRLSVPPEVMRWLALLMESGSQRSAFSTQPRDAVDED